MEGRHRRELSAIARRQADLDRERRNLEVAPEPIGKRYPDDVLEHSRFP